MVAVRPLVACLTPAGASERAATAEEVPDLPRSGHAGASRFSVHASLA